MTVRGHDTFYTEIEPTDSVKIYMSCNDIANMVASVIHNCRSTENVPNRTSPVPKTRQIEQVTGASLTVTFTAIDARRMAS